MSYPTTLLLGPPKPAIPAGQRMLRFIAVIVLGITVARANEGNELPSEPVTIVLFAPADLAFPEGARQRITQIADAAEAFFFNGMTRQGYPPAAKALFRREADGEVEVLQVRGDKPAASGAYAQPTYAGYVRQKAVEQDPRAEKSNVWWIFIYLGDRPTRFENWAGMGNPRDGGWAMINYDTVPGEIRPDLQLTEGFNFEYKLKSTLHELAHGFGLPHMGPDPTLGLGNSLMGPNPPAYAARRQPKGDHVYLAAAEAAMLWKHPLFQGRAMGPFQEFEVKLEGYKASFHPDADTVTVAGRLVTSQPAHSVVLIDDRGDKDEYWSRSYAARIAPDGTFEIKVNHPARVDGQFRLLFCFDSGLVSGNGKNIGPRTRGDILKTYRFRDGRFEFAE